MLRREAPGNRAALRAATIVTVVLAVIAGPVVMVDPAAVVVIRVVADMVVGNRVLRLQDQQDLATQAAPVIMPKPTQSPTIHHTQCAPAPQPNLWSKEAVRQTAQR